jgi:uncharacterized membrane protein YjgN (DUF898 family)
MTADTLRPVSSDGAVRFLGDEAAYWRLRAKGAALLVATLGLYRFWFATDVRRFMWSNTEIGGETLEYTGLATELLGGFLLAIAILMPLYTAIAGAALALDNAEVTIAAVSFVLLVLLAQFALYRARRYRLTRTAFRGLRFDQHGPAWRYAIFAFLWWSVVVLTLGLAYPWAQASLQRYKMRHTSYGDLPGSFAGTGWSLFRRGWPIWLVTVGPIVFAFLALGTMVDWDALNGMMAGGDGDPMGLLAVSIGFHRVFFIVVAALGGSIVAAVLLYPLFQALMLRWWVSGLRFGALSVSSRLRAAQVYRIYLRFILCIVPFSALMLALGGVCVSLGAALTAPNRDSVPAELVASALLFGCYVLFALGVSTIYQVVVTFAMWRLGVQSAELAGADALDSVRATGVPSSALGEGLVDALGVGGI